MTYEPCPVTVPHQAGQKTFLVTLSTRKGTMVSFMKIINSKFNRSFLLGNLWNLVCQYKSLFLIMLMPSLEHDKMERYKWTEFHRNTIQWKVESCHGVEGSTLDWISEDLCSSSHFLFNSVKPWALPLASGLQFLHLQNRNAL